MKTTTFEEQRERNNVAYERVTATPGTIRGLSSRQRQRVDAILTQREEIENLASTQWQREAYGIEEWHRDFVRLRDLHDHPNCTKIGEKLRQHVWNAIPNSRFKRFQQAFCTPENFIVPAFDIDRKNRVTFRGNPDFDTMSLQPCLVSADCIPDKLVEDLKLASFADNAGKPLDRLKKKADPRVINGLKKIWESLMPLQSSAHRILSIQPGDFHAQETYPDPAVPDRSILGKIIYTREAENGKEQATQPDQFYAQRTVMFFESVHAAFRKTVHEEYGYQEEIGKIAKLTSDVEGMNTRLNTEWSRADAKGKEALWEQARDMVAACQYALRGAENVFKVQAEKFLGEIGDRFDASKKPNMGGVLSKMVASRARFQKRFDEMYAKDGYNKQDMDVLRTHIRMHTEKFKTFRAGVQRAADMLNDYIATTNGSDPKPSAQSFMLRAGLSMQPLQGIRLEPFATFQRKLGEKFPLLGPALDSGDFPTAKKTIVQMHVIGKFQGLRSYMEHMKEEMTHSTRVPVASIRDFTKTMRTYFETYQVFPDLIVDEYRKPFETMQRALVAIEQALTRYAKQDIDVGRRTALYRMLKEYVEAFDIEHIVESLA